MIGQETAQVGLLTIHIDTFFSIHSRVQQQISSVYIWIKPVGKEAYVERRVAICTEAGLSITTVANRLWGKISDIMFDKKWFAAGAPAYDDEEGHHEAQPDDSFSIDAILIGKPPSVRLIR